MFDRVSFGCYSRGQPSAPSRSESAEPFLKPRTYQMKRWFKAQFSDVAHARRAVLRFATVIGTLGFFVAMGSLLLGR